MSLRLVENSLEQDSVATDIRLHLTDDPAAPGELRLPRELALEVIRSIALGSGINIEVVGYFDE